MMSRRKMLQAGLLAMTGMAAGRPLVFAGGAASLEFATQCKQLEKAIGGRLGVAMMNTATGARQGYRENERFPMCSTSKLLIVGAVLTRVDHGQEQLARIVHYANSDVVTFSPATEKRVAQGMSIAELCEAALTLSDNTAANLLLTTLGGPSGVTRLARTLGDSVTELDRNEPALNEALPGDPRDTTTPAAMMADMRKLVLGNQLSAESRAQLKEWMIANTTGDKQLRSGVPRDWTVGDKTGSGERGTLNDIGVFWPPNHAPILATVYLTNSTADREARVATIASVGKLIPLLLQG